MDNVDVLITNRAHAAALIKLPPGQPTGLECAIVIDEQYAAIFRFHDVPRADSRGFVGHLAPQHGFTRVLLVSGDRESEVRRLAEAVAIPIVYAATSPEEKVRIVRQETERTKTLFIGDGINDAPALMAATVGIAFGQHSDVTSEAARAVIIDTSLSKVDELLHVTTTTLTNRTVRTSRMRRAIFASRKGNKIGDPPQSQAIARSRCRKSTDCCGGCRFSGNIQSHRRGVTSRRRDVKTKAQSPHSHVSTCDAR